MIYIVDDIGKVVQSMRNGGGYEPYYEQSYEQGQDGSPYYMFGHRQEISNRLTEMTQRPIQKRKKYPLIALKLDTIEIIRGTMIDFRLNLVIATLTEENLNAEQRMAKTFKPILYPLYEKFMKQFANAGLFTWDSTLDQRVAPHTKVDRPFWGTPAEPKGNIKNIFNDPIDAIEIIDLKFSRIDEGIC